MERIILGSRGSDLALAQAGLVEEALRRVWPELEIKTRIIRTSGDEGVKTGVIADRKAGRKGMFTREIERELRVGRIDVAVHSAKDLPSEPETDLKISATLPRARTDDMLIAKNNFGLISLPNGATIATGSVRRRRQLSWRRPDLEIVDLRGNVPTRLRKLSENESWSGIVLARAGLERLGLVGPELQFPEQTGPAERPHYHLEVLPSWDFVPAGGQGIIALQVRGNDKHANGFLAAINDEKTHLCLRAEREFLRLLDGDCDSPVGVRAEIEADRMTLRAHVFEGTTTAPRNGMATGPSDQPEVLAEELMKQLYGG